MHTAVTHAGRQAGEHGCMHAWVCAESGQPVREKVWYYRPDMFMPRGLVPAGQREGGPRASRHAVWAHYMLWD